MDPVIFLAFLPAALALNFTPGPDMLFCLAQGTRGGPRPAIAAAVGISTGTMIHVTLAGLGLGVLTTQYPILFDVIRYVGIAYLVWLAWKTLTTPAVTTAETVHPKRAFRDGLIVNLTNPKVILFILAFVPQFVDPARPVLPQFLAFGAVISVFGTCVNATVGVCAGGIGRSVAQNPRFEVVLRWVTTTIFGALAVRLILEGKRA